MLSAPPVVERTIPRLPACLSWFQGDVADYTTTVLTAMEAKVAQEMKVAPANVDITASAGSVVLTINIGYDSAEEASEKRQSAG